MKKIFFLLMLYCVPLVVQASGFYQDITILPNGNLKVIQSISLDGEYNGFDLKIKYKLDDTLYSAEDLEIIRVCESNKHQWFSDINNCFDRVVWADIGDDLVYTLSESNDSVKLKMYNSSERNTAFYVEYILKNVIVVHDDIAELRINILDKGMKEHFDQVKINLYLPMVSDDLRAWAHGPLWGNIRINDDKNGVNYEITDYIADEQFDIRATFDKDMITSEKVTNQNMLSLIIEEETIKANEANKLREDYTRKMIILKYTFYTISGVWILFEIFILIKVYLKYDKEFKSDFDGDYYREFPSEHSPEVVQYLLNHCINTNGLSACLLNIIYKKGLKIKTDSNYQELKNKKKNLILSKNDLNLKEPLTENEMKLRNWFLNDLGDGSEFSLHDLKKVSSTTFFASQFLEKYNEWIKTSLDNAKSEGFFITSWKAKMLSILYSFLGMIIAWIFGPRFNLAYVLVIISIFCIIYLLVFTKKSKKGIELYNKWNGLKNFIDDFGNFSERELPDIILWEKYLVYASLFGLADKLRKEMEIRIPSEGLMIDGLSTRDYIYLNNAINQTVFASVNSAVTSATTKVGSASSGSGAGGGFSGGGGSSGGRF